MTNHTTVIDFGGGDYSVSPAGSAPIALPPNVYGVTFDRMSGTYSIHTLPNIKKPTGNVYGNQNSIVDKIANTYDKVERSLGVIFDGDRGIGKTSTTLALARKVSKQQKIPVFMIKENMPGLANFLGTLGECVIIFDEFEKNFSNSEGQQAQFLPLFDGLDSTKRMYVLTVNEIRLLNKYFLNRPGRFHYKINFQYPDIAAIRAYLNNETTNASQDQIEGVVKVALRAKFNYDHLRAICLELNVLGPDEPIEGVISDLNIEDNEDMQYMVSIEFKKGNMGTDHYPSVDLFSTDSQAEVFLRNRKKGKSWSTAEVNIAFSGKDVEVNSLTGEMFVPLPKIESATWSYKDADEEWQNLTIESGELHKMKELPEDLQFKNISVLTRNRYAGLFA